MPSPPKLTADVETLKCALMSEYKRNQIEESLSRLLEPEAKKPSADLLTRTKRLLELDRRLGQGRRSPDRERSNYAFYSAPPRGSGVEVWFSAYESFALFTALRLMAHGWPQGVAVVIMRRVRKTLEPEHSRVLKQDPKLLFDEEELRRRARPGGFAIGNTDPVFLTVVSQSGDSLKRRGLQLQSSVARGTDEAIRWASEATRQGGGYAMFELVNSAHLLAAELNRTEPRRRGPGA